MLHLRGWSFYSYEFILAASCVHGIENQHYGNSKKSFFEWKTWHATIFFYKVKYVDFISNLRRDESVWLSIETIICLLDSKLGLFFFKNGIACLIPYVGVKNIYLTMKKWWHNEYFSNTRIGMWKNYIQQVTRVIQPKTMTDFNNVLDGKGIKSIVRTEHLSVRGPFPCLALCVFLGCSCRRSLQEKGSLTKDPKYTLQWNQNIFVHTVQIIWYPSMQQNYMNLI